MRSELTVDLSGLSTEPLGESPFCDGIDDVTDMVADVYDGLPVDHVYVVLPAPPPASPPRILMWRRHDHQCDCSGCRRLDELLLITVTIPLLDIEDAIGG